MLHRNPELGLSASDIKAASIRPVIEAFTFAVRNAPQPQFSL